MGREVDARRRTTQLRLAGRADSGGRELGRGGRVGGMVGDGKRGVERKQDGNKREEI